ncbi:MAG: hypothetical protein HQM08_14610 [Candidatus Riflebacteria bacterium]|nr:hypothetical protein [Candidatus Riflebacteria bacterium]
MRFRNAILNRDNLLVIFFVLMIIMSFQPFDKVFGEDSNTNTELAAPTAPPPINEKEPAPPVAEVPKPAGGEVANPETLKEMPKEEPAKPPAAEPGALEKVETPKSIAPAADQTSVVPKNLETPKTEAKGDSKKAKKPKKASKATEAKGVTLLNPNEGEKNTPSANLASPAEKPAKPNQKKADGKKAGKKSEKRKSEKSKKEQPVNTASPVAQVPEKVIASPIQEQNPQKVKKQKISKKKKKSKSKPELEITHNTRLPEECSWFNQPFEVQSNGEIFSISSNQQLIEPIVKINSNKVESESRKQNEFVRPQKGKGLFSVAIEKMEKLRSRRLSEAQRLGISLPSQNGSFHGVPGSLVRIIDTITTISGDSAVDKRSVYTEEKQNKTGAAGY